MTRPNSAFVSTSRIIAAVFLTSILFAQHLAPAATPKEIDAAIAKARDFLLSHEKKGSWDDQMTVADIQGGRTDPNASGATALAAYALIAAGVSRTDPHIVDAVQFVQKTPPIGITAVAERCLLWSSLGPPWDSKIMEVFRADAAELLKGAGQDGQLKQPTAFYGDLLNRGGRESRSSYWAPVGLWAASQSGIDVPPAYWSAVDYGWRATQGREGGWTGWLSHRTGVNGFAAEAPTMQNTVYGAAALLLARGFNPAFANCTGKATDENLDSAIDWIGDHAKEKLNMYERQTVAYMIARVGCDSGRKYLGSVDWYKQLIGDAIKFPDFKGNMQTGEVCFELLFLTQACAPIAINKLDYDLPAGIGKAEPGNWDLRPGDACNLVRWLSSPQAEGRQLNWQVVKLNSHEADLDDAPILYIAGNRPIDFTPAEIDKLRKYTDAGGTLFANADCATAAFATSMRKLAAKLYPSSPLRELPANSPIYVSQQYPRDKWHTKPRIEALSNGTRELFILAANDPARFWQTQNFNGHEESFQFMDDLLRYETHGGQAIPAAKGVPYIVRGKTP